MNCPKCDAPMSKVTFDGVEVDRCDSCRGLWFDAHEKEKLKDLARAETLDDGAPRAAGAAPPRKHVMCPVCKTRMITMTVLDHPGLQYESCTVCYGAFFDPGEFKEFKAATGFVARLKGLVGLG